MAERSRTRPVVVDLFAGAGGFSRGFREEGFEIAAAVENFKPVARTFSENFPEATVIVEDVKRVEGGDILEVLGSRPDVVIGGPPCEPFTSLNAERMKNPLDRLYRDPIGRLVLHFVRLVGELRPRVFVMENVPQIMEGGLRRAIRREFASAGYRTVYFNVLRAEDYGNPSRRTRVFISNIPIRPKPLRVRRVVIDAIGDLPPPSRHCGVPNHEPSPIPRPKLGRLAGLRWGEALVRFRGADGEVYSNWLRLHPYEPAPTVFGKSRFIHPFEDRLLTVREHARLMGFPDDHIFYGGRDVQYDQVGEAVPIPLARAVAREVMKALSGEQHPGGDERQQY